MVILRAKRNRLDVVKHLQQRIFIKHFDYLVYWPFVTGYASYSEEYVKQMGMLPVEPFPHCIECSEPQPVIKDHCKLESPTTCQQC